MKLLAIEREEEGIADHEFEKHLKEQANIVWQLHQSGVIHEIYFRADQNSSVLIDEANRLSDLHTFQVGLRKPVFIDSILLKLAVPIPGCRRCT